MKNGRSTKGEIRFVRGCLIFCWVACCLALSASSVLAAAVHHPSAEHGGKDGGHVAASKGSKAGASPRQVVMIVVNGLSFLEIEEWKKFPGFSRWLEAGAVGAMNLRTAGTRNDVNNYVTIGTGVPAVGAEYAGEAYHGFEEGNTQEKTENVYGRLTGYSPRAGEVLVLSLYRLIHNNAEQPYPVEIGALGEAIAKSGGSTAVLGNLDLPDKKWRLGPLIAMDGKGTVRQGDVTENTLLDDPGYPYGKKTNYAYLYEKLRSYRDVELVVIELGDLYRLYHQQQGMSESQFTKIKGRILRDLDVFLGRLLAAQEEDQLYLLLSPMVNRDAAASGSLLAPVVLVDPARKGGILTSATTRQEGIVANIDVAPTVLNWLRIPVPGQMMGEVMTSGAFPQAAMTGNAEAGEPAAAVFWQRLEKIFHIFASRSAVLYHYITYQVIVLLFATLLWIKASRHPYSRSPVQVVAAQVGLLALLLSPLLFLAVSVFPGTFVGRTILYLLVLGGILCALLLKGLPFPQLFFLVGLLNWLPVVLDGLGGADWMKGSYLGYDPVIGARYYGIGNEYMGVVIGSSLLCVASWLQWHERHGRWTKVLTAGLFAFLLFFFAAPSLGTNAGGALTAAVAYSVAYVRLFHVPFSQRTALAAVCAGLGGLAALFLLNLGKEAPTHIGKAIEALLSGNFPLILDIIERKLEMNVRLIRISSWSKVFVLSLFILGLIFLRPRGLLRTYFERYPFFMNGVAGIVVASLFTLFVNDSGIVAAATAILYGVVPLLYLVLKEKGSPSA
ncbi:membrane protein [Bacillaceae bacterium]